MSSNTLNSIRKSPLLKEAGKPTDAASSSTRLKPLVILLLLYVWWYLATPYVRFPELGDIRFERILVALIGCGIVINGGFPSRPSPFNFLIPLFYVVMYVSFMMSPYAYLDEAQYWQSEYWKVVAFYYLIIFGLRDRNDLYCFLVGIAFVSLLYQVHSWLDFLHGGSYVYQQGIKRMIGVWSGGGIGSANAWGMLSLFSLPFGVFVLRTTTRRKVKLAMVALIALCVLSIVFSGTRGALVGVLVLLFAYGGTRVLHPKFLLGALAILTVVYVSMPPEYRHRYSLIVINEDSDIQTEDDVIASESATSRIMGFVDGWNLALLRPLFGFGPGTSAVARLEVRPNPPTSEKGATLQLHNLYGQVLGETGFLGAIVFVLVVIMYFTQLRRIVDTGDPSKSDRHDEWVKYRQVLMLTMFVMLLYGMFTHSLYRYHWMILFGCHNVLMNLAPMSAPKTLRALVSANKKN